MGKVIPPSFFFLNIVYYLECEYRFNSRANKVIRTKRERHCFHFRFPVTLLVLNDAETQKPQLRRQKSLHSFDKTAAHNKQWVLAMVKIKLLIKC